MISVIIPTLNEVARIGALQKALARETVPNEVILVDGGSENKTTNEAAAAGAVVLSASGGRGAQLVALMEDYDLVRCLEAHGNTCCI